MEQTINHELGEIKGKLNMEEFRKKPVVKKPINKENQPQKPPIDVKKANNNNNNIMAKKERSHSQNNANSNGKKTPFPQKLKKMGLDDKNIDLDAMTYEVIIKGI